MDTDCQTRTCTGGACGLSFVGTGIPTATQTGGDCHQNQCDGAGNIISVVDDSDVPDTGNQCTGTCSAGVSSTGPAAAGKACAQTGGVLCDGHGACTQTVTVVRVGTGTGTLGSTATPAFLETYYPLVGATPVIVPLPTAASGANQPLMIAGSSTTEGGLSRSEDGHYLSLAGYAAAMVGAATSGTTRVVGRVDAKGTVDTTTTLAATAFAGSNVRAATSVDGTNFWVSGTSSSSTAGGVWYVPFAASAGGLQVSDTPNNMRMVNVFGGALYGDSASGTFLGVLGFGGLPTTTGATATNLSTQTTANAIGFTMLDLDATVAGLDTLFVADGTAGLERWTNNGTTWSKDTTFTVLATGCLGVAGWANGSGATLVVAVSGGTLQRVDVPTTGAPTATVLVTAASNTAYRGVALAAH